MNKASPKREPAPSKANYTTTTTKAGRRGASSLWYAERTLRGKQLTADDVAILSEALNDLREILKGAA